MNPQTILAIAVAVCTVVAFLITQIVLMIKAGHRLGVLDTTIQNLQAGLSELRGVYKSLERLPVIEAELCMLKSSNEWLRAQLIRLTNETGQLRGRHDSHPDIAGE